MLHLNGISKQYGSKILFDETDLHIGHRSKTALIGPNGAGKSTLIKIILGLESADHGTVSRASHLSVGYLAQEVPKFSGRTVLAEVTHLDGRRETLHQAKTEFESLFSQNPDAAKDDALERYGRILEEIDHLNEATLEARAKDILMGMGFQTTDFHRSLTEFSGGWLMRVALARNLLMDPDLLLLDEPTNHLDLESLLWLEEFLINYRGALLMISHDTAFLNRIVTEVLEIDQKKVWAYRGNLDAFVLQKEERLRVLKAQYAGQQAKIAEIEAFVSRFGAKATKARQAQSRLKQLEKMDLIELPEDRSHIRFRFPVAQQSGREVITLKSASVQFEAKPVLQPIHWVLRRGSRVAIVGVNGAGKTTLLKLLSGVMEPTSGQLIFGHNVKVGYYAQHQAEALNLNSTILQELEAVAPEMPISQVRAIGGAFLFSGDAIEKKCGVLSGGEKARVALAKLLLSPANFLILDEPTNHLDAESRGVLLDALVAYEGTLCIVSHDRNFIGPLVDTVIELNPQFNSNMPKGSELIELLGSYDDYLKKKQEQMSTRASKELLPSAPKIKKTDKPLTETKPITSQGSKSHHQIRTLQREREKTETEISQIELKLSDINLFFSDPESYKDVEKTKLFKENQEKLEALLEQKMSRWESLCQELEGTDK